MLPLVALNPMGKDHIAALLDRLIGLDADAVAETATAEAARRLENVAGGLQLAWWSAMI
jgi:hypothetical protein